MSRQSFRRTTKSALRIGWCLFRDGHFPPTGMQRYPSITRDYRAGGSGAAPAGASYRGNRTAGEVPQWLVDTCNEDNEYDEEYEYQQQDDYRDNSAHVSSLSSGRGCLSQVEP